MHEVTRYIKELWELEFTAQSPKGISTEEKLRHILKLRGLVPEAILNHYDRFNKTGKAAIVAVRNGVCIGCFVRLSSGALQRLLRQDDLNLCENCGRYIYPEVAAVAEVVAPPPLKRPRQRRVKVA